MSCYILSAPVALIILGMGSAVGQCVDSTDIVYGQSTATRFNGNAVRLYSQTSMTGNHQYWWYPEVKTSFYLNGSYVSGQNWTNGGSLGALAWQAYTPTLQVYGIGTYYMSALHDVYTTYCGGGWGEQLSGWTIPMPFSTTNSINIARPTITRGVVPYFLGSGITQSDDFSPQTALTVTNANGAPETPQWSFIAGGAYGSLGCTNCGSSTFTATQAGRYCGAYDVVLKATFNGFDSDPLYIDIQTPKRLNYWGTTQVSRGDGWESDIFYQVADGCNNGMTNVEVNEVFSSWNAGPGGAGTNWLLPLTAEGFSDTTYLPGSGWLLRDVLYEQRPQTPNPQNTGANGYDESDPSWITHHVQHWRVGSPYNGGTGGIPSVPTGPVSGSDYSAKGIFVQINDHNHYLDHGAHKNQQQP